MSEDQAPRTNDPADPVVGSPDEVANAGSGDEPGTDDRANDGDLTRKADTTREAASEPSG